MLHLSILLSLFGFSSLPSPPACLQSALAAPPPPKKKVRLVTSIRSARAKGPTRLKAGWSKAVLPKRAFSSLLTSVATGGERTGLPSIQRKKKARIKLWSSFVFLSSLENKSYSDLPLSFVRQRAKKSF